MKGKDATKSEDRDVRGLDGRGKQMSKVVYLEHTAQVQGVAT
jgi:hypothetical protein